MKSLFGLNERLVAPFSYLGWALTGILVFIFEKENRFVRFHALQSTITFGALAILSFVVNLLNNMLSVIPVIGIISGMILTIVLFALNIGSIILWVYLMYTSWQGKTFKVPIIGDIVWDKVNS